MEPITLRIQTDLLSEIESEADDLGYSSRAEYIRQLLQNREYAREALSTENSTPVVDPDRVESNIEQIEALRTDIEVMREKIKLLEQRSQEQSNTTTGTTKNSQPEQKTTTTNDSDSTKPAEPSATSLSDLEGWLEEDGPQSENAVTIIREAAEILREDGPLKAGKLKDRLNDAHPDKYSSKDTLWVSTVERVYEDAPGFSKPSYGTYDFD